MPALSLPEALFILALSDEKLKVHHVVEVPFSYGFNGAILAELALRGKIGLKPKGKVVLLNADLCADDVLDGVLTRIVSLDHSAKVHYWIENLSGRYRKTQKLMSGYLLQKGVFKIDESQKLIWAVPFQTDDVSVNAPAKYLIKQELRQALLTEEPPSDFDLALLYLVYTCSMMFLVFTRDEQKFASRRLESLVRGKEIVSPLTDALEIIKITTVSAALLALAK